MKEKLLKVKEALTGYINVVSSVNDPNDFTPKIQDEGQPARDAIVLLDSIISMLGNPWQPIETAPIDGTEIVIQDMYYDKNGNKNLGERYVAYYNPGEACWFDGSGTWIDVCPDYWMPLPAIKSIRDKDNG